MNKTDQAWIIVQRWWIFKKNANHTNGKNKCLVLRFSTMDRLIIEVTKVMTRIFLEWPRAETCYHRCICLHTLVSYLIRQCLKGMNKLNVSIEHRTMAEWPLMLYFILTLRAFLTGKIVVSWKSRKRIPGSCFWLKIYIKFFLVKDHFLRIKETCHIFILSKNRQIRKCLFSKISDRIIKYVSTCNLKKLSLKIALKK